MEEKVAQLEAELQTLRNDHQEMIEVCKGEFEALTKAIEKINTDNEQRDKAMAEVTDIVSKMLNNMLR